DEHAGADLPRVHAGKEGVGFGVGVVGGQDRHLPRVALGFGVGDVVAGDLDRALEGLQARVGGVEAVKEGGHGRALCVQVEDGAGGDVPVGRIAGGGKGGGGVGFGHFG